MADEVIGRFPAGINNVAALTEPPRDQNGVIVAARDLLDVDLDASGKVRSRRGQHTWESRAAHSLFDTGTHLLAWCNDAIHAYADDGTGLADAGELVAGLGPNFVTYASDDFDTYWSNNVVNGRIAADLSVHAFWVDTPHPVSLSVIANGGLAAGAYEVSVTVLDADGRESGASNPVILNVTLGQGIAGTLPSAPTDAVTWRVYRTSTDGEGTYLAAELPIAATTFTLGHAQLGKPLETAWLFPLLPCHTLRYGHGRILGLTATALIWSEAYRLGLMHDQNVLGLTQGTLLEPVGEGGDGAGWYLADAKRTYWFGGADPKTATQRIVYPHAAVPGTSITVSGEVFGLGTTDPVAFWLAANGTYCLGLPGGQVQPLRSNELALPIDAERGASALFVHSGIRQAVTSIFGGQDNPLNASLGDEMSATIIRRNGITV
jgi:hypothetical protein